MFFDFTAFNQESFTVKTIFELLKAGPKDVVCLEWQPEDGRAIRYLKPPEGGTVRRYCAAGNGYSESKKATFKMETFENVPVDFLDWELGVSVPLKAQTVDVALCTQRAVERLGPKGMKEALKESARVLKPHGQFILIREEADRKPLPDAATSLFETNETLTESGLVISQLLPRPPKAPASAAARTRSRPSRAPPAGRPGGAPGGSARGRPRTGRR